VRPDDVPAGPILVDTDVATWLLTDADQVQAWRPLLEGHLLALSFANVGELLALPLAKSWGLRRRQQWANEMRRNFVVIPFSFAVAECWAPLHVKLRGHLHAQGANDLWVASTALASEPNLPVATNNRSDFDMIALEAPLSLIHPEA